MGGQLSVDDMPRPKRAQPEAPAEPKVDLSAASALDPRTILSVLASVRELPYIWDLTSDRILWPPYAARLLGVEDCSHLATSAALSFLMDPEHAQKRAEIVRAERRRNQTGVVPYAVQFRLFPKGRNSGKSVWIEDRGCCYSDANGKRVRACGLFKVGSDRYQLESRLAFLRDYDELTGQMNRARLTEAVERELVRVHPGKQSAVFLMVAVNNLTSINEAFGFEAGDEVIASVGRRLKAHLRLPDVIGRYSSNKFGIILSDCGNEQMAIAADRLRSAVRESVVQTSLGPVTASVSIGGVLLPTHAQTVGQVVGRSLEALETAKTHMNDVFVAYEPSPKRESARQRNCGVADAIVSALNERRLLLALQPIVSTADLEPKIYECLLRLRQPDGKVLSAGAFIPVAEQLGLAGLIDHRVAELAVRMLRSWPDLNLSMNVSSLTATDSDWLSHLRALTGAKRDLADRLTIEITETAAIRDIEESKKFVHGLKDLGCRVAIDDFGAGHSSFRNLKMLGVDMLKIDGSFTKQIEQCEDDRVFVRTLVKLSEHFGMKTVSEWVSDANSARIVQQLGVDYMQGFYFGEPQLAEDTTPYRPAKRQSR